MLKEYIKPELIENSIVKATVKKYADEISSIISKEEISYEDFRAFAKNVLGERDSKIDLESIPWIHIKEGSYIHERKLKTLYNEELSGKFSSYEEKLERIIKVLCELTKNKE